MVAHFCHLAMIFLLCLSLYGPLSICVAKETISINTPWAIESDDITCSQMDEDSCVIQCNAPYACGSRESYHDLPSSPKPHIICPSHASSCIIHCMEEGSCKNSVIRTGDTGFVEINIHQIYNNEMTIHAPRNGILHINVRSDEAMFDRNVIHAHDTDTIVLDCNGKGSCQRNQINGEAVTTALHIACRNGNNCDGQEIHCPDNNKPHMHPECNVLCDYTSDSAITSCSDLNIFAMNGTNQRNGVGLECDERDNAICDGATVYCRRGARCDMSYDLMNREWYCEGLCGGKTAIPSRSPTMAPTIHITQATKTDSISSTTQSTKDSMWFDASNATESHYNEFVTVLQQESYVNHNLQVLAYILMGCLVGGFSFCMCVICVTCCFVEGRLKRYQSNNSTLSSVSYEYYGAKPPSNRSGMCGTNLCGAIKNRLNAIAALTAGHIHYSDDNKEQNNPSIQEEYQRSAPQHHLHVRSASPTSKVSNKKRLFVKEALAAERSDHRKQSNSSSASSSSCSASSCQSASSSSSGSETVFSDSRSTTYDEYGNTCYVAIKSTRPIKKKNGMLETQSIAISVNTSPRNNREEDEEKAFEFHEDRGSTDSSFNDETCTECTLCNHGHQIIDPEEESSSEDVYDAYEDAGYGSNDNKRYRIEVSGPSETTSTRRTETSVQSRSESSSFLRPK